MYKSSDSHYVPAVALDDSDGVPKEEAMFLDVLEDCFLTRFV